MYPRQQTLLSYGLARRRALGRQALDDAMESDLSNWYVEECEAFQSMHGTYNWIIALYLNRAKQVHHVEQQVCQHGVPIQGCCGNLEFRQQA